LPDHAFILREPCFVVASASQAVSMLVVDTALELDYHHDVVLL
jgi:hypothetical protein